MSVLGEIVTLCLENNQDEEKHTLEDLYELIDFWRGLKIRFLHPNERVAIVCYNLYKNGIYKDDRLKPSDLVHLGYALAYDLDYLISSDKILRSYQVPSEFKLEIKHPKNATDIFRD